jgi:hypothetical protein
MQNDSGPVFRNAASFATYLASSYRLKVHPIIWLSKRNSSIAYANDGASGTSRVESVGTVNIRQMVVSAPKVKKMQFGSR